MSSTLAIFKANETQGPGIGAATLGTAGAYAGPTGLLGWRKRALDIVIAGGLAVFTAPLLLAIAVAIKLQDGGPILFRHARRGHRGTTFTLLKFRTMRVDAEEALATLLAQDETAAADWHRSHKLTRDPRVTRLGRFLRRSSLDELPQILNVLRGEMSIVGPRPIVEEEHTRYRSFGRYYDAALPGITGLWQVTGRSDTTFQERIAMDATYVAGWTFRGDVMILLNTIPAVLFARGAR